MLNGYHTTNGNHETALVAYIYGELDEPSRNAFESHLAGCDDCAIELAAVSDARLGVVEWRRTDFEHLATPEIVVPFDHAVSASTQAPEKAPLFAGLVESLLALPLFARAGVGLAAAALLVGAIYLVGIRSTTGDQVADVPKSDMPPTAPKEAPYQIPEQTIVAQDNDKPVPPQTLGITKPENTKQQLASSQPKKNSTMARNVRVTGKEPSGTMIASTRKAPRLNNFEEDEDKTLRLVDLFAEIGPSKK